MKKIFLSALFFYPFLLISLDVEIHAKNALLIDADTERVIFEKRAHEKVYPASITKVATALYLLEKVSIDWTQEYIPTDKVLQVVLAQEKHSNFQNFTSYVLEHDGVMLGIMYGERVPLWGLMNALLVGSKNDAANVLAEAAHGSIPEFMKNLNEYLLSIGCTNTKFYNPHGLHYPGHYTTAYDLGKIAIKGLENPYLSRIVQQRSYLFPKTNKSNPRHVRQSNALLTKGKFYYPYAVGMKIGFMGAAGYTIMAAAKKEGRTLIAIVLGCESPEMRYQETIRLFEAAFAEQKQSKIVFHTKHIFQKSIEGLSKKLKAHLKEDLCIEYYPSEQVEARAFVRWDPIVLPIKKGQIVGEVRIEEKGKVLSMKKLFAEENFSKSWFHRLFSI